MTTYRVGLVVPSSNTTMETEVPELLRRRQQVSPQRFTCHSSRVAMRQVTLQELARMNRDSDRCAEELADARCDVLAYACLVAIMAEGPGAHVAAEQRLAAAAGLAGHEVPVVSSAGALVALADQLHITDADAIVLSACVELPSLPAVPVVQRRTGLPVLTAATATVRQALERLDLTRASRTAAHCWTASVPICSSDPDEVRRQASLRARSRRREIRTFDRPAVRPPPGGAGRRRRTETSPSPRRGARWTGP